MSLGVGSSVVMSELETIASDRSHVYTVNGYNSLNDIVLEMLRGMCSVPGEFHAFALRKMSCETTGCCDTRDEMKARWNVKHILVTCAMFQSLILAR